MRCDIHLMYKYGKKATASNLSLPQGTNIENATKN